MEPTTTAEAKKPKGGADGCLDGGNSLSEVTLMRQANAYWKQGYRVAVDMDLAKFFDSVEFSVLMHRFSAKVRDPLVRRLVWRYLRAGVEENGQWSPSEKGVPQGGPLSPLLANVMLHDLDMELERRGNKFVRYADDFLVLVRSESAGRRVMASLMRFLERKLKLTVNPTKCKVAHLDRFPLPGRKSVRETCRVTVIHLNRRMRTRKSGGVGGGS